MNQSSQSEPRSDALAEGESNEINKLASVDLSAEGVDPMAELKSQVEEEKNKYLYLYAEFETYKKRAFKERQEASQFGWERVARDLLGAVDNLTRGITAAKERQIDASVLDGLLIVHKQMHAALEKHGVVMVPTTGSVFDPNIHEAVGQEPNPEITAGHVSREEQAGYTLHGRLLRPARVFLSLGASVSS